MASVAKKPPPSPSANPADARTILQRLSALFDVRELSYKPQAVSKDRTRALAIWYVDARAVMDRLDAVMGLDWSNEFETYEDGTVVCKISLWIDSRLVTRSDVGGPSGNEIDRDGKVDATFGKKTAFSDGKAPKAKQQKRQRVA
jgi:hypothetical protein